MRNHLRRKHQDTVLGLFDEVAAPAASKNKRMIGHGDNSLYEDIFAVGDGEHLGLGDTPNMKRACISEGAAASFPDTSVSVSNSHENDGIAASVTATSDTCESKAARSKGSYSSSPFAILVAKFGDDCTADDFVAQMKTKIKMSEKEAIGIIAALNQISLTAVFTLYADHYESDHSLSNFRAELTEISPGLSKLMCLNISTFLKLMLI
jgi:hypothetical protein